MPFGAFSERGETLYIQPNWARDEAPLQIPENYSGTAMNPHPPIHISDPVQMPTEVDTVSEVSDSANSPSFSAQPDSVHVSAGENSGGLFETRTESEDPPPDAPGDPGEHPAPEHPFASADTPRSTSAEPLGSGEGAHGDAQSVFRKMPPPHKWEGAHGGLFSRFPFLTSLLPPKHHGAPPSSDLALVVGVFLLLSDNKEDDVLPLLLLLLLA